MKQKRPKPRARSAKFTGDQREFNSDAMDFFRFYTGAQFGKSVSALSLGDQHLLRALRTYYAYTHNGYLLIEALRVCTQAAANPETWVLNELNHRFQDFVSGNKTLPRALSLSAQDRKEYEQFRAQHPLMGEVHELAKSDPDGGIARACVRVATKHRENPETLEKRYRRFWKGFFEYVASK